ncbi:hypothetical protein M3I54_36045 [Paraburkholderia sp. CNPSo 3274]|uniref:hypothetical protein n=1 Tax=unclassified Paraburkholderia TaxID=2615204 RepID=UPI0020B69D50|nr:MULTISPECIES: hypothetical protein [unclassified Paraburkholderia]MCP3712295.1 hypothetical protein [Paraburkholderia sp. CNPSo 3274]MCP3718480.1 hypothetical protein [Paraburkholderia sp. CNPSo 3281]MCP3724645.1 hypothetical protein [Paraburkholderia sp. CNPSo 3272]
MHMFFSSTVQARFGRAATERTRAMLFAVALFAATGLHRLWGFAKPHHAWLRVLEVRWLGHWAPSSIEHLAAAFAGCVLFVMLWSSFVSQTTRNRALLGLVFAVLYGITSTWKYDGREYLATGDVNQLAQMVADVFGLLLALAWLTWPERSNRLQYVPGRGYRA